MKFLVLLFLVGLATAHVLPQESQEEYIEEEEYIGQEEEDRSISDIWNKVKNWFGQLEIDLKQKYMRFGEWVKNKFRQGLDKGKSAVENIKRIAKEFIHNAGNISSEVADEAKEFFDNHRDDLGAVYYEVKDAYNQIKRNQKPNGKIRPHRRGGRRRG